MLTNAKLTQEGLPGEPFKYSTPKKSIQKIGLQQ